MAKRENELSESAGSAPPTTVGRRRRRAPGSAAGREGGPEGEGGNGDGPRPPELVELLRALHALEEGDFTVRVGLNGDALMGEIGDSFNRVAALNERLSNEVARVATTVG